MNMKKICYFICMLLITSVITISTNADEEISFTESIDSFVFSEPKIVEIDQYISLELEESTTSLMEPGKPVLPVCTKIFKFPFKTKINNVECKPLQINQKLISKDIQPAPNPSLLNRINTKLENIKDKSNVQMDKSVYEEMDFYPNKWYDYNIGSGLDEDKHVVFLTVRFYPVQYSPGKNTIQYAKSAELKINYIEPTKPVIFPDTYDMVVITPSEFSSDLQPLIDYKNDGLIKTKLVTLDDIYTGTYFPIWGRDDQEKIKRFIFNAAENWGVTYALLAGGGNKISPRYTHVPDGEEDNFISDLYYADIYNGNGQFCDWDANGNDIFGEYTLQGNVDQVDLFPDVNYGRLNFRNFEEVTPVVNKLITYESTAAYLENWFSEIVVCGGDTFEDSWEFDEGEALNQDAIDMMSGFSSTKIWATNGELEDGRNIDDAINEGAGFFYCSGHGTSSSWATHPHNDFENWIPFPTGYRYSKVEALENGEMLPIVYIGGCSNSKFSSSVTFTWSFLKNPNGGGISSYGYTALGWGYTGIHYDMGLVGGMELSFFRAYTENNPETTGELWCKTLNNYITDYGMDFELDIKTIEEFQPFCDPSLRIKKISNRPLKPDKPEGPDLGIVMTEYTYTASAATDPDGDMMKYCFDWGDGTVNWSDWIDSGTGVSLKHTWDKPGFYEIKIKVRDQYGLDSPWSESLTMHIQGAIIDIDKISGGLFRVSAVIKNIGDIDVSNIDWMIQVKGGIFDGINVLTEGTIDKTIPVGGEEKISSNLIFGLGKVEIRITASSPISNIATKELFNKWVFGPFIIV